MRVPGSKFLPVNGILRTLAFFASYVCLFSCSASTVWGYSLDELKALLAKGDYSFIDSVPPARYEEIMQMGPEAPWLAALHFQRAGRSETARSFLRIGASGGNELVRHLCGMRLAESGPVAELSPQDIQSLYAQKVLDASLVAQWPALSDRDFPSEFKSDMDIRLAVFRREYGPAWQVARRRLESAEGLSLSRAVLSDFARAALYGSADPESDAAFFDRLADRIREKEGDTEAVYVSVFYAGRLYARSNMTSAARDRFIAAMEMAVQLGLDGRDFDSPLWYTLDLSRSVDMDLFLDDLERWAPRWVRAATFTSMLDSQIAVLVQRRDWKRLAHLRSILPENTDSDIRVRLDYLFARSDMSSPLDEAASFVRVYEEDHGYLYYRILAGERLGLEIAGPDSMVPARKNTEVRFKTEELDSLSRGLLEWGLHDRLYTFIQEYYPSLPLSFARELYDSLEMTGRLSDGMRIMVLALRASTDPVTVEDLSRLYPRPWLEEIEASAAEFSLEPWLLYALIRSESFFQNTVVSHAGAIGLTQLMASTASDVARKLRVGEYDLNDPATNIRFGAYYLSEMISRLDGDIMSALFAYNAGISRVRTWRLSARDLSADLFLESLPFAETREYGRKVLAAAVVYGYLYYRVPQTEIVRTVFPDFMKR